MPSWSDDYISSTSVGLNDAHAALEEDLDFHFPFGLDVGNFIEEQHVSVEKLVTEVRDMCVSISHNPAVLSHAMNWQKKVTKQYLDYEAHLLTNTSNFGNKEQMMLHPLQHEMNDDSGACLKRRKVTST